MRRAVALGPQVFRTNQLLAQLLRDRARWAADQGRPFGAELAMFPPVSGG